MKLLFDENVSDRLAKLLADVFPDSSHVRNDGLRGTEDRNVWELARKDGFTIVSKDTGFRERSYGGGTAAEGRRLDVGNAGTKAIEDLLRRERERERILRFTDSEQSSLLILSIGPNAI